MAEIFGGSSLGRKKTVNRVEWAFDSDRGQSFFAANDLFDDESLSHQVLRKFARHVQTL
ncbi:hypothetical protein D3C81_2056170 [compost metagenome]